MKQLTGRTEQVKTGGEKIFQKILVPLGGSKLAECALPYAEELAKGCNTEEVILVSATERVSGRTLAPETQERFQDRSPDTNRSW